MTKNGANFVTLKEAATQAGVSISALRKWYRSGAIDSKTVQGPNGMQRVVDLAAVKDRAERWQEARVTDRGPALPPPLPDGTMLVPLEAWERTMDAVNSLQAAGERIGRAEEKAEQFRARINERDQRIVDLQAEVAELKESLQRRRRRLFSAE